MFLGTHVDTCPLDMYLGVGLLNMLCACIDNANNFPN